MIKAIISVFAFLAVPWSINFYSLCIQNSGKTIADDDYANGGIVFLRSVENGLYLNGHTFLGDPEVGIVDVANDPLSPQLSGTRWRIRKYGQYTRIKSLGFSIGDNRWLDGHANPRDPNYKAVKLAPTFEDHYTGTRWLVEKSTQGYKIKNQNTNLFLSLGRIDGSLRAVLSEAPYEWEIVDYDELNIDSNTFLNPVADDKADPWVLLYENSYYYCHTGGNKIFVTKADSLHKLDNGERHTAFLPDSERPYSSNIWAPELHKIDGKFYLYFTAGKTTREYVNQRMYVASADAPIGPFTFIGQMKPPNSNNYAIDGTILQRGSQLFFIWCGKTEAPRWVQSLYIAEMSSPTTISTSRRLLSTAEHAWENKGGFINEAPQVLKKNDRIHIVYSASSTFSNNYCLGLLTWNGGPILSQSSWDKKQTPIFENTNMHIGPFSPGHVSFTKSLDGSEDWLVYHTAQYGNSAKDMAPPPTTRRWVSIKRFGWTNDNAPDFGEPVHPFTPMTKPR